MWILFKREVDRVFGIYIGYILKMFGIKRFSREFCEFGLSWGLSLI